MATRIPLIGITMQFEAQCPALGLPRYKLASAYADAVVAAGGTPVLLGLQMASVDAYLAVLDGVILSGSSYAMPAAWYLQGEDASPYAASPQEAEFEQALARGALEGKTPLLGVCGGMQVLNGVSGGRMVADAAKHSDGTIRHRRLKSQELHAAVHAVDVTPGSLLSRCVQRAQIGVNSMHLEAVVDTGPGVRVGGRAPDGTIEAIEIDGCPFALGVQWHPEQLFRRQQEQLWLFEALVRQAQCGGATAGDAPGNSAACA